MPTFAQQFRGYSSIGTTFTSPVKTDLALATQDLLNHLNTRKGERVMMPTFGSIVWDMLFEPLDDNTVKLIEDDMRTIVDNDPRWTLENISVTEGPNALNIELVVTYVPSNQSVTLPLTYNKGTTTS